MITRPWGIWSSEDSTPQELAEEFELYYCAHDANPFVSERIIIPVRMGGKLVGWQARKAGAPVADEPKYYTAPGTPKSRVLYDYDRAKEAEFGVVVEGVTDVWRVGPPAVAVMGARPSATQLALLVNAWRGKLLVNALDADQDQVALRRVEAALRSNGVHAMRLPLEEGRDPGDYTTGEIHEMLRRLFAEYAALVQRAPAPALTGPPTSVGPAAAGP